MTIRVLLFDDSEEFLESVAQFLTNDPGLQIVGRQSSAKDARTLIAQLRPDLVLMDLAMPGTSGLDATGAIKRQPDAPRVIILTLYDAPEIRQQAEKSGADGFVSKSEVGTQLLPLIHQLFEPKPPATMEHKRMKNILIVDDSTTMRRMVRASLQGLSDVDFHDARSGLEAIERLSLQAVDLMILDLNMPDMHGLDVLNFLRRHHAYQSLPVIVLTTRGDDASRTATLAAGASAYLTKPFQPADLQARVKTLLAGKP